MSWADSLRLASYRGVPFGVKSADGSFGRRNAIHEYPFRDTVFVEDLGRQARRIGLLGFLVENSAVYGGGDVITQREFMVAQAEAPGDGELIHPTLGRLQVSLLSFTVSERWDQGRYFELGFSFIEAGQRVFPSIAVSTGDAISSAADGLNFSSGSDFVASATADLKLGAAVVKQAVSTAASYARLAQNLANDATNLHNLVGTLQGSFGRYFGGRNKGGLTGTTSFVQGTAGTVSSLINQGTVSRNQVSLAAVSLNTVAGNLGL